jgi:integrase
MPDDDEKPRREYGSGSVYYRKSDARWVGTIEAGWSRTGARRRVTVTGKTEAEAKRKLRDKRVQIEREGVASASSRTTVKAWAETWLADRATKDRPKTHTTDRGAVEAWIVPTIGHKRLEQLTPADVRAVTNALRTADKSTATAKRYHGVLMRMLKAAVQEGVNVPPRVLVVDPPAANVHDRRALPVADALAIMREAQALPHGSRWALALLTGMRQGECLGLTREALGDGFLTVSWQLQALPYRDKKNRAAGFLIPDGYETRHLEGRFHLVRPKSKAGWRVIPLIPPMREALARWLEIAPPSPRGLVYPDTDGRPRDLRSDTAEWQALQEAAGVEHPAGRPYHVHEARNTAATILLELEVPESVRIQIMGHSSIATTRGYETHSQKQALEALVRGGQRLGLS